MIQASVIYQLAEIFETAIRKLAKHPSAGILFVCPEDKTVFLTKRSDEMSSPGTWDLQGGRHDDEDKNSKETATREATEEISVLPSNKKLVGNHVLNKEDKDYIVYIYSISKKEKGDWTPKIELDFESEKYKWFPYDKLPENTHLDLSWVKNKVDEMLD